MISTRERFIYECRKDESEWCLALYGNHDEHQCYLPPGHDGEDKKYPMRHMCYCGVWW